MMNLTMSTFREIPLLYMGFDELNAFMSGINAKKLMPDNNASSAPAYLDIITGNVTDNTNSSIWRPQLTNLLGSGQMDTAPTFYALNGYVFANNPIFHMCVDDPVIWYVYAHGTESHIFHMHGNGFRELGVNYVSKSMSSASSQLRGLAVSFYN
ncbi:hypothetical protein VTN77DRAFT_7992 [Rasamsonia byssochlamydoides]|uniref:uncharacterized protein n=1 Tax=Rasamsonia byssochlamydoides TaxID=89139 RepID=UPI0037435B16